MNRIMKLGLVALVLATLWGAAPAIGAAPAPSGTFTLNATTYQEGGSVTFSFSQLSHVNPSYEITLGIWCTEPSGVEIPWGNRNNPYVYEFNSFGKQLSGKSLTMALPAEGTGYFCEALFFAVDWEKNWPVQSWGLDFHTFQ